MNRLSLIPMLMLTACATAPQKVVTYAQPPAARIAPAACPDEPLPPGEPDAIVNQTEDYVWQSQRDVANDTCRESFHWLQSFFQSVAKRYPTISLDTPDM